MIKTIRKTLSLFLIVCMIILSTINCVGEIDVVKSYYLLKYEYKNFLDPLTNAGATESELIKFFGDIEEILRSYDDLNEKNAGDYLENALYTVLTYDNYKNLTSIIFKCYSEEIDSYVNTGIIPPSLVEVYDAVIRSFFDKVSGDKTELVKKYEGYQLHLKTERDKYTLETVTLFEQKLVAARKLLEKKGSTQNELDNMLKSLDEYFSLLELKQSVPDSGNTGNSTGGVVNGGTISGGSNGGISGGGSTGGGMPSGGTAGGNIPDNTSKTSFSDVSENYWGKTAIMYLYDKKIINGFEDGTFRPEALVTREQFAKMLVGALNLPNTSKTFVYSDVVPGSWYEQYVFVVSESGLMKGMGNEKFGTGLTLIRQDLAVIADRIITEGFLQKSFENVGTSTSFSDISKVSDYAKESVLKMQKLGVINGTGGNMFTPSGGVTRAQAAQIIYNLIK